jgi:hypothetical protein
MGSLRSLALGCTHEDPVRGGRGVKGLGPDPLIIARLRALGTHCLVSRKSVSTCRRLTSRKTTVVWSAPKSIVTSYDWFGRTAS